MGNRSNKTKISEIVDYWSGRIDECDLSVDWAEAEEYCWNCGSPKELTRCHIVPHSLGGRDEPSNYVVLCRRCHEEAPNVEDPRIMWDWLVAHKTSFYKTYWIIEGMSEYEFIYKRSVAEELQYIVGDVDDEGFEETIFKALLQDAIRKSTRHFGQSSPNRATVAGVMRVFLMELAESYDKRLPNARELRLTREKYFS